MFYKTGRDFERAVFGLCSEEDLFERFRRRRVEFGEDVRVFISQSPIKYPGSEIGEALYSQMVRELVHLGVDSEGLVFLPSVNTPLDLHLGVDAVVYHPLFFPRLITIDAFNIRRRELSLLRESWIDGFEGDTYSNKQFHSDLFLFHAGMARWKRDNKEALEKEAQREGYVIRPKDFRSCAKLGRWKNQLILTPSNTDTYEGRRDFAKLVVGHLVNNGSTEP